MALNTRNGIIGNYDNGKQQKSERENRISRHLKPAEQRSILASLEPSAKALCTGACVLLKAENSGWTGMEVGVICFIRDPHAKEYVLSLLYPKADERLPATVLWTMPVSAFFETERTSDEHLLTFTMESYPRDVCGLKFHDPQEADEFHRILVQENRGRKSRVATKPKRQAPPPSSQPSGREAIERLMELSNDSPEGDNEKKEHQKSFLGGLFTMKNKEKERKKLDISAPTQFQHLDHLGLEELSKEDQETFHHLIKVVDIEPGNEEQMQLLRIIVATRGPEVRNSMRIKESYSERPSSTTTEPEALPIPPEREAMTTSYSPVGRRKMSPYSPGKLQARNNVPRFPRPLAPPPPRPLPRLLFPAPTPSSSIDIKQRSADVSPVSNDRKSFFKEIPNVDKGRLRHVDPTMKPIRSEDFPISDFDLLLAIQAELDKSRGYIASDSDEVPRLPPSSEQAPRLPERSSSKQGVSKPARRIEMPSPRPLAPPPPRPLPRLLFPAPTPPPSTDIKKRSADVSPVSNDRRSSLQEIPNVEKGRLRHVDPIMKPIQNEDSPIGDFDLLSAIQAELDKRRD